MESLSSNSARMQPRSTSFRTWAWCAVLALAAGCAAHQGQPATPPGEAAAAESTPIEEAAGGETPEALADHDESEAESHRHQPSAAAIAATAEARELSELELAARTEAESAEWILDEETGQRYRVIKVLKRPPLFRWLDEERTRIRYRYGMIYDVVDYDDEWFWVKEWAAAVVTPPRQSEAELAAEEAATRERVAAAYASDVATVDRLELRRFDAGLPQRGQWRQGFGIADMNGDGHLDIVHGSPRKSLPPRPYIYVGDGRGGWRDWLEARFPPLAYDYGDTEVGDLNGDGHQDIVLGFHIRGMAALVGDGEGGFTPWSSGIGIEGQQVAAGAEPARIISSRSIELVDWNRNGRLDILSLAEGPQQASPTSTGARGLMLYVNQGDGTWTRELPADEVLGLNFGDNFALGDFNGDGLTDIAIASAVMSNRNILGFGTEDGQLQVHLLDGLRPSAFLAGLAIADHDGDGRDDLFLGYQSQDQDGVLRTGIDVFSLSDTAPSDTAPGADVEWQRRPLIASEGPRGVYAIDAGDVDGDGLLDVVAVTGHAEIWVFLGDGDGFFVREESPELPPAQRGCRGYALRLHDLDGDGRDEVIVGLAGERTGLLAFEELTEEGCPGRGSLRVWTPVPRTAAPPR